MRKRFSKRLICMLLVLVQLFSLGCAVPVFAVGTQSQMFAGRQDNTDIPKKICKAMGVEF